MKNKLGVGSYEEIAKKCLQTDPEDRSTFANILNYLSEHAMVEEDSTYTSEEEEEESDDNDEDYKCT
jgi:hypothetical protein